MNITMTHGDKLNALLCNNKLPMSDRSKVKEAIGKYTIWRNTLLQIEGDSDSIISKSVELLNNYKSYIEVDLIFASKEDFLFRQKGQLKIDNAISSSTTTIDEIIILRKAKRIGASERQNYSSSSERITKIGTYREFLNSHPFAKDTFARFIEHIANMITDIKEDEILSKGYF